MTVCVSDTDGFLLFCTLLIFNKFLAKKNEKKKICGILACSVTFLTLGKVNNIHKIKSFGLITSL